MIAVLRRFAISLTVIFQRNTMPDNATLYIIMKSIHLTTLTITISGFILRGIWMMRESPLLQNKVVKTIPHYNDTILLISAVWTGALIGQYHHCNNII